MRTSAVAWSVVVITAALLLTACSSRGGVPEPSGLPTVTTHACPAARDAMPQGLTAWGPDRLDSDTRLWAVVECVVENRPVPGDGVWAYVLEKRATANLEPLATALRADDEPVPWNQACSANLPLLVWFAVVTDDGTWLRPRIPETSCGQPQQAVSAALGALTFTTVSATKSLQVRSQRAVDTQARAAAAGCAEAFKDMLAIDAAGGATTSGPISLGSPTGTVSVCHYAAVKDSDGTPMLTFVSGRHVSPTTAARLVAAAAASGPVTACTKPHTQVTGVQAATGAWLLVEADGCRRVLDGDTNGWGQATPTLLAALAAG